MRLGTFLLMWTVLSINLPGLAYGQVLNKEKPPVEWERKALAEAKRNLKIQGTAEKTLYVIQLGRQKSTRTSLGGGVTRHTITTQVEIVQIQSQEEAAKRIVDFVFQARTGRYTPVYIPKAFPDTEFGREQRDKYVAKLRADGLKNGFLPPDIANAVRPRG